MLGDKAYDSAELREGLHKRGTKPVIPNRRNRKQPFSFNKRLYKLRWRIEGAVNRLKELQTHRNAIRQTGEKLPRLCLPRRRAGMVDLMSPDPSVAGRRQICPALCPEKLHCTFLKAVATALRGGADFELNLLKLLKHKNNFLS
jgi:hypothetical protein